MNVNDALDRLDAIHEQLARSTPIRGYRAATVLWTALLAAGGGCVQAALVGEPLRERSAFLGVWVGLAGLGILSMLAEIGRRFALSRSRFERHGLLRTLFTLLPAFGAAGVLTMALAGRTDEVFVLLPGLWMLAFALAVFASLPRLPVGVGWIGCWYFTAGAVFIGQSAAVALSPWTMGGVFGVGQLASAYVMWRHPEARMRRSRRGELVDGV